MTDTLSEREKMLAGEICFVPDAELNAMTDSARVRLKAFNETPRGDPSARMGAIEALLGRPAPKAWMESPFFADYGVHIELGDCFVNVNCTFLDSARIVIGDLVALGPNVQLLTATHPVDLADRFIAYPADPALPMRVACRALPITIEHGVWIGAGAIVLPGVTIGRGSMIGAGSVVTRSVPAWSLVAGNPARVVRQLEPRPAFQTPPGKA